MKKGSNLAFNFYEYGMEKAHRNFSLIEYFYEDDLICLYSESKCCFGLITCKILIVKIMKLMSGFICHEIRINIDKINKNQ